MKLGLTVNAAILFSGRDRPPDLRPCDPTPQEWEYPDGVLCARPALLLVVQPSTVCGLCTGTGMGGPGVIVAQTPELRPLANGLMWTVFPLTVQLAEQLTKPERNKNAQIFSLTAR